MPEANARVNQPIGFITHAPWLQRLFARRRQTAAPGDDRLCGHRDCLDDKTLRHGEIQRVNAVFYAVFSQDGCGSPGRPPQKRKRSVLIEHLLNLLRVFGLRQRQLQQNARFLRIQRAGGNKAVLGVVHFRIFGGGAGWHTR